MITCTIVCSSHCCWDFIKRLVFHFVDALMDEDDEYYFYLPIFFHEFHFLMKEIIGSGMGQIWVGFQFRVNNGFGFGLRINPKSNGFGYGFHFFAHKRLSLDLGLGLDIWVWVW